MDIRKKAELLIPAGSLEKLKFALLYGADSVYVGGKEFGLRSYSDNFNLDELRIGVKLTHNLGKRIYVTVNAYLHDKEFPALNDYLHNLIELNVDAVIVSDIGVFHTIRNFSPHLKIHISTQANTVNSASINFWKILGASRIILARELTMDEIKTIALSTNIELESFIHGAMCISYSGRCLLSNYLTGRDSNLGQCTQPCRWKYFLQVESREGRLFPIFEDKRGSYVFNSKDLCMLEHLDKLITIGLDSFKIEGRMKSVHYVATVTSCYRKAIDALCRNIDEYRAILPGLLKEIKKISNRNYCSGFYFGRPDATSQNYLNSSNLSTYDFVAIVLYYDKENKIAVLEERNNIKKGEIVEFFQPTLSLFEQKINILYDENNNEIDFVCHPKQIFKLRITKLVEPYTCVRRKK